MKIKINAIILGILFLLGQLFCADFSYALKMNVEPPRVVVTIQPGRAQGGDITVLNDDASRSIHVKAYISDLVYLPDGSNDFLDSGTTPWSVAKWLKISPTEFDVPAGEQKKVRYVTEVPQDAQGGRYGVVFFEISPPLRELKENTAAAINIRIGSIFLVTAKGTEVYNAELENLTVGKPDSEGNIVITCNVKNSSNVLIRPFGSVKILDDLQTKVIELKLNEEKSGVLPGTSREFSVQYNKDNIASGEYSALAILDYGGDVLLGGRTLFTISE